MRWRNLSVDRYVVLNRRYMVRNGRYIWKIADIFEGTVDIVLLIMMIIRMYVLFRLFCSTI
ncbi:hypothetical protein [Bacillus sp. TL12]|uniref:hypothetical protein n=1 Tax=Bacillus sp. TL12 TaxID=2894756 RepID=UPI001F51D03C|nr:hypothetical protein [Bacillus sp. TL12]MCI0765999.1 hypothetical protein [Bacillus sp. TL12]